MDKIPFTVYDFFAYLSSGAVVLAAADYAWHFGLLSEKDVSPILAITLVIFAYVLGHVVAQFSSALLENVFVARVLKRPFPILLGAEPRWRILKAIFPGYFRQMPTAIRERVRTQAAARKCVADDEALFLHVYPVVTSNERSQARQDVFLNQYGFSRNMAFAFAVSAVCLFVAHRYHPQTILERWPVLAAVGAVTMFYRYLKFFRQYSFELLIRYAELSAPDTTDLAMSAKST